MNRRDFFGKTAVFASWGLGAKHACEQSGVRFGIHEPPPDFPAFNWIDFPESISSIDPLHDQPLVTCADEWVYRLSGCHGRFKIDDRNPRRLWVMHINELANVHRWYRR